MKLIQHLTEIAIEHLLDICPACHSDLYDGTGHSTLIDGFHNRCVSAKFDTELLPEPINPNDWRI